MEDEFCNASTESVSSNNPCAIKSNFARMDFLSVYYGNNQTLGLQSRYVITWPEVRKACYIPYFNMNCTLIGFELCSYVIEQIIVIKRVHRNHWWTLKSNIVWYDLTVNLVCTIICVILVGYRHFLWENQLNWQ